MSFQVESKKTKKFIVKEWITRDASTYKFDVCDHWIGFFIVCEQIESDLRSLNLWDRVSEDVMDEIAEPGDPPHLPDDISEIAIREPDVFDRTMKLWNAQYAVYRHSESKYRSAMDRLSSQNTQISELFRKHMSSAVLAPHYQDLKKCNWYEVWNSLWETYSGERNKAQYNQIAHVIATMEFEPSSGQNIIKFMNLMRQLFRIAVMINSKSLYDEDSNCIHQLTRAIQAGCNENQLYYEFKRIEEGEMSLNEVQVLIMNNANCFESSTSSKGSSGNSDEKHLSRKEKRRLKHEQKFGGEASNASAAGSKSNNSKDSKEKTMKCWDCGGAHRAGSKECKSPKTPEQREKAKQEWLAKKNANKEANSATSSSSGKKQSGSDTKDEIARINSDWQKKFELQEERMRSLENQVKANHAKADFDRSMYYDPTVHMASASGNWVSSSCIGASANECGHDIRPCMSNSCVKPTAFMTSLSGGSKGKSSKLSDTSKVQIRMNNSSRVVSKQQSIFQNLMNNILESSVTRSNSRQVESHVESKAVEKSIEKNAVNIVEKVDEEIFSPQVLRTGLSQLEKRSSNVYSVLDEAASEDEGIDSLADTLSLVNVTPEQLDRVKKNVQSTLFNLEAVEDDFTPVKAKKKGVKSAASTPSIREMPERLTKTQAKQSFKSIALDQRRKEAHMVHTAGEVKAPRQCNAILDTGATHHMFGKKEDMTEFVSAPSGSNDKIKYGNCPDFAMDIKGRGNVAFLKDVLFVPDIQRDLISGPELMRGNYLQMYLHTRGYVYRLDDLKMVMSATLSRDGLIHVDEVPTGPSFGNLCKQLQAEVLKKGRPNSVRRLETERSSSQHLTDKQFIFGGWPGRPLNARNQVRNEAVILHNRLGHCGEATLLNAVKNHTAIGLCVTEEDLRRDVLGFCTACHMGKFKKLPAPASMRVKPTKPMEVICSDIVGPFRTRSSHGAYNFQLSTDVFTQWEWISFHASKDEATDGLRKLVTTEAARLGHQVKILQSDSDRIYKDTQFKGWCNERGIITQYTAPYRHEGLIEAKIKEVLDRGRTVIADSGIAEVHWEDILEACVWLINRLPGDKTHPDTSPYERLYGTQPDLSGCVPLGYPAVFMRYKEEGRTTLESKGDRCRVIGYAEDTPHSYKIVTDSGKLLIRKDVVVDENFAVTRGKQESVALDDILQLDEDADDSSDDESDDEVVVEAVKSKRRVREQPAVAARKSTREKAPVDRLVFQTEETIETPKSMALALKGPQQHEWIGAMNEEMKEIIDRGVIVPVKPGEKITSKPFDSKFALRIKKLENQLKYKVRLVVKGFASVFGEHYDETYSPTIRFKSLLFVLQIAKMKGWFMSNIDVGNAYLEAESKRQLYMWLPREWTGDRNRVLVRLARNLYGLKDAGLLWYLLAKKMMEDQGFTRSVYEPCVFIRIVLGKWVIIALFVDDYLITCNVREVGEDFKAKLAEVVKKIKNMENLELYTGVEFEDKSDTNHLVLSLTALSNDYIAEHVKHGDAVRRIPLAPVNDLERPVLEGDKVKPINQEVGKLRYLADKTRPDLLYVASRLGSKGAAAPPAYQEAVKDVMKYLAGTTDLGIHLGGRDSVVKLFGYADASFVRDRDSKSQLGYCMFLTEDSAAVVARSIKDKSVSLSSCEAEVKCLCELVKDILWGRGFLAELGEPQDDASELFQDNQATIRISENVGTENHTAHILNKLNFIRQEIEKKTIKLTYIPRDHMIADMLTGPRPREVLEYQRAVMMKGHWAVNGRDWREKVLPKKRG